MSDAPKGPKSAPSLKCFGYNAAVCSVERSCPFVCEGPCEFHRRLESELGSATGCGLPDSVPGYLDADYKYFTYELAKAKKIRIRAEGKWGELLKGMKDGGQRESKGGDRKSKSDDATLKKPKLSDLGITRDQASKWQQPGPELAFLRRHG